MDHNNHTRLDLTEIDGTTLRGATIYDPMDENVGSIAHVHGAGANMQVAVDVGTFLGMGGKTVLIPVTTLDIMLDNDGTVRAKSTWTKNRIEALPEHTM